MPYSYHNTPDTDKKNAMEIICHQNCASQGLSGGHCTTKRKTHPEEGETQQIQVQLAGTLLIECLIAVNCIKIVSRRSERFVEAAIAHWRGQDLATEKVNWKEFGAIEKRNKRMPVSGQITMSPTSGVAVAALWVQNDVATVTPV